MKNLLPLLAILTCLSACGTEVDFAEGESWQSENQVDISSVCTNEIQMTDTYSLPSTSISTGTLECVTICEVALDPRRQGRCLAETKEEYCAEIARFRLEEAPRDPNCYILYNGDRGVTYECACD
jgi:hypothetical protein